MNEELYFKDAFTEVDGNINLDVNNLNTNCITSKNNKFSLDSDGNLIVNSITTIESNDNNIDFDLIYPVGSIYFSTNNVNPNTLFGGIWKRFANGQVLVGVDETQIEFNAVQKEGGEKNHKLVESEMPSHTHTLWNSNNGGTTNSWNGNNFAQIGDSNKTWGYVMPINYTGGSQAHNNLQPYITCYIWMRVS